MLRWNVTVISDDGLPNRVRREIDHAVDTGELLLDDLRDARFERFGRSTRIAGTNVDRRRGDVRILFDGQRENRAQPREHDDDRDDPREDGAIDEDARDHFGFGTGGVSALRAEVAIGTGRTF